MDRNDWEKWRRDLDKTSGLDPDIPRHYTQESWSVILIGMVAATVVALYGCLKKGFRPFDAICIGMVFGGFGTAVLVARSRIRSVYWANVVLCGGIFLIALGASLTLTFVK